MVSKKILRMGVQKTYEIFAGSDGINIEFLGSNRQFAWLEISLVYNKSDKYTPVYDSYNVELAAKYTKKYSIDNLMQEHLLYKQFVAWSCDGWSIAPLIDYIHNSVYQELIEETDYFGNKSDEKTQK